MSVRWLLYNVLYEQLLSADGLKMVWFGSVGNEWLAVTIDESGTGRL